MTIDEIKQAESIGFTGTDTLEGWCRIDAACFELYNQVKAGLISEKFSKYCSWVSLSATFFIAGG